MWILGRFGFISIVQHKDDADTMQVRSRVREDILMYFPEAEVITLPGADYLYRANIARQEVADVMFSEIMSYDVTSHVKDVAISNSPINAYRQSAYYQCWRALSMMQPYAPYSRIPRAEEKRINAKRNGVQPWLNDFLPHFDDEPDWNGPTMDVPEVPKLDRPRKNKKRKAKQGRDDRGRFANWWEEA